MSLVRQSKHRLVELASLSPETERLWRALPRGARFSRNVLVEIAAGQGVNAKGALLRVAMLRRSGFVEEFALEERTEWRVVE